MIWIGMASEPPLGTWTRYLVCAPGLQLTSPHFIESLRIYSKFRWTGSVNRYGKWYNEARRLKSVGLINTDLSLTWNGKSHIQIPLDRNCTRNNFKLDVESLWWCWWSLNLDTRLYVWSNLLKEILFLINGN